MGAEAFAERARIELNATGEYARERSLKADYLLTPQEAQIARLVSEGYMNRDIASQLFVSPSTVDYHPAEGVPEAGCDFANATRAHDIR
jgi:DNA-binding NarL/FixJ family response regulator